MVSKHKVPVQLWNRTACQTRKGHGCTSRYVNPMSRKRSLPAHLCFTSRLHPEVAPLSFAFPHALILSGAHTEGGGIAYSKTPFNANRLLMVILTPLNIDVLSLNVFLKYYDYL